MKGGVGCRVEGDKLYRWRGDSTVYRPQWIDQLDELNLVTGQWSKHNVQTVEQNDSLPPSFTSPSCVATNRRMYVFGGCGSILFGLSKTYYRDVYELDLTSFTWYHLRAVNEQEGPMAKYLCGMVLYDEDMLVVFGGFGVKSNGVMYQSGAEYHMNESGTGMWTNEMHLFHISDKRWITPHTTGLQPPPCAAFSFTKIDRYRVLLFAGQQQTHRTNDIYILNMATWHWTGPINQMKHNQSWPSGRSLHTAACLINPEHIRAHFEHHQQPNWLWSSYQKTEPNATEELTLSFPHSREQRVLILWGQDNNDELLTEAWVLQTNSMTWQQLAIPEKRMIGRKWHSTATYYPSSSEAVVVTLGGYEKYQMNWVICPDNTDSVALFFGIPPLYQICLKAVSTLAFKNLSLYLPSHVLADINEWRLKEANMESCQCIKL